MVAVAEALDFAVSSGMRADLFREASRTPEEVFARYERHKRQHLQTAQVCETAGFEFVPMVLEAHAGGWSTTVRGILDWIAQQVSATQNEEAHNVSLRIAQRMSCTLHRENARAVLRRTVVVDPPPQLGGWGSVGDVWQ